MSASIPQISNLHPFALKDAEKDLRASNLKTIGLVSLAVISAIAITAILGTIIGLAIAGVVLTGPLPFILSGASFGTVLLALGAGKAAEAAIHSNKISKFNKKLIHNLDQIKDWNDTHVKDFFEKHNLNVDPTKQTDSKSLKNLIARYTYLETKFHKHETKSLKTLSELSAPKASSDLSLDRHVRETSIDICWKRLEGKAFPYKLQAAHCLELIKNPFNHSLKPIDRSSLLVKTYALRHFDRKQYKQDGYINLGDRSLTFKQVKELSIHDIREKLYDK